MTCCSSSAKAGKANKCQEKLKTDNAETGGASYGSEEDADGPGSDEEEYEREARSTDNAADKAASVELLPFKTRDGELVFDKSNSKPGRLALVRRVQWAFACPSVQHGHRLSTSLPHAGLLGAWRQHNR